MSMPNDPKLRGASKAAKNIRGDAGSPSFGGQIPEARQIFQTSNDLRPVEVQYTTLRGFIGHAQNHRNRLVSAAIHWLVWTPGELILTTPSRSIYGLP